MIEPICVILVFFMAILVAVSIADRINVPAPIFLVPAGIAAAYIPYFPIFRLDPDIVLFAFLPPLVYSGGFFASWGELRKNLRPVFLLSVGLVIFSTICTAWFANRYIPGFGWAVALVLGSVVSPPDDVAIIAMADKIGLPRRIVSVLEGEGLFNDATALTIFRFALALVAAQAAPPEQMALSFAIIAAGEIAFGYIVGWVIIRLRRHMHNPELNTLLSLMTPYLAYVPAAFCGGSGVLAAAVAGIYMGRNAPKFLPFTVRLQGQPAWVLLSFLLNSSLFFLTGLQFRPLLLRLADYPRESLILYGVMVTLAVILIRFIWVFPAAYLPRLFSKKTRENDPPPSWRLVFIVGWAGMRGAISLAAALSIPVFLGDYAAFPQRDMIIFLTFCVIFGTLVLQGLGLKPLVRLLNIHCHVSGEQRRDAAAQEAARRHSAAAALDNIKRWKHEKRFSPSVLKRLHDHYARGLESLDERRTDGDRDAALALITVEREALLELRRQGTLSDHQLREVERDLDVMESQVHRGRHLPF